uniref:Uncharacterized protein n=1 Tax=Fagus sylvatica TaxID=28930 RepID=A0A2N9HTF0_FAGSY
MVSEQASPVSFSDHQASPWSSWTSSAHQVSLVTISASSRTVSALQAPPVTISASPRLLGFHHLGFLSHHKTRWVSVAPPAPPDLDLGISVAPLSPPALGGPRLPFGTPVLCLDLWVSHRQWVSVALPAPPGLAGAFLPLVALGFLSGFDSWLSGYRVSAILLL